MSVGSFVLAIIALGFLIVVHEGGHYFVARWCKMRVERFSIGFGPGILKRTAKSGTVFQLAPIPFGGFVEIKGMNIAEEVDPDDIAAYPNRPAWQRFVTILAGPATNYFSAIFLMFAVYTCYGEGANTFYIDGAEVGYDSATKVQHGDRIIAVNGEPMYSPNVDVLTAAINKHRDGKPITLALERDFHVVTVTVLPKLVLKADGTTYTDDDGNVHYRIGVRQTQDIVEVGVGVAAVDALKFPIDQTKAIVKGLRAIFAGREKIDPGGPVRIVKEFSGAFSRGIVDGIGLLAALSVYLGLFNLFPLPALDGGRLVFLGYEMVTRRRANPKIETMVHMVGIMVLMVVMILVTLNDVGVF